MLTPAQKHRQRILAQLHSDRPATVQGSAYEQILHRLRTDEVRLKQMQSTENKVACKQTLLPDYDGWIDGVLSARTGQADEVFMTVLVWQIDCGQADRALDMAEYALAADLPMPDRYHRTLPSVLVDEICDPVLTLLNSGTDAAPPVSVKTLARLETLTQNSDMPDEVRAKLHKTMALILKAQGDPAHWPEALARLKQAMLLHPKAGVKQDIKTLTRALKNADNKEQRPAGKPAG